MSQVCIQRNLDRKCIGQPPLSEAQADLEDAQVTTVIAINEMEQAYVDSGGGLVKFWLEISRDEQLKRFTMREQDPRKQWKITDEDWRNREKWELYDAAIDEMLARTSTAAAPWTVVESDDKWFARIKALKTVISYGERLM